MTPVTKRPLVTILLAANFGLVAFVSSEGVASNSILKPDQHFTSLCIGEGSTGFNWIKGSWKRTNFHTEKTLVIKEKRPKNFAGIPFEFLNHKNASCFFKLKKKLNENEKYMKAFKPGGKYENSNYNTFGCFNIRRHGSKYYPFSTQVCDEHWHYENDSYFLRAVTCNPIPATGNFNRVFRFQPEGFYQAAKTGFLGDQPHNDYKDSISIEHGKCSLISAE